MSDDGMNELVSRYEKMLRGESGCYFDAEEFDEIALEYENSGSIDDALLAVENGLKFHPDSDILWAKRACYMLSLGRLDEARASVSHVRVDNEESYAAKIELFFNDSDFNKGLYLMKLWLDMPDITPERCLDALDLCIDFNIEELPLSMILASAERLPVARRLGLFREIVDTLDESGYGRERYAVYEKILDMKPFSKNYWKEASLAYMDAGNVAKAVEAADFAVAVSPGDTDLLLNKAYCLYEAGDFEHAAEIISKNLSRIHDKSYPYEVLAECFCSMGNHSKSDCVLDIAQEIYPDNARYWYIRAKNQFFSDNTDYGKCIDFLKQGLRLSPDDVSISILLAEVYFDMERYSDARGILGRLVDLNIAEAKVYTLLGDVEIKAGFPDIAIGYYRKVIGLEIYNVDVYFKLIYAYSVVEDVDSMNGVIERLEGLIEKASDSETADDELSKGVRNIRKAIEQIKSILRNSIDDTI